ncbi:hypothetical protein Tco_0809404 [Tanacetum coccineum]
MSKPWLYQLVLSFRALVGRASDLGFPKKSYCSRSTIHRPTTLGETFYLARIIEARLKAIAKKEKEHIIKKKADNILSLQSELASPDIKGSLDGDEDIGVDEVSSAINGVFDIGKVWLFFEVV